MTKPFSLTRRSLMAGTAAATASLAMPSIVRAQDRSLKVGVYGGYFKDSFDEHIFPAFTEATGIEVESIAEPTGEAWLVQLQQAARAGMAPADVSMMSQTALRKGIATELWTPVDTARIERFNEILPPFVAAYPDDRVAGVGAVSWYITLVSNTESYPQAPESWAFLWDPSNEGKLGLLALASNSFLLEVTAKTFFGGTEKLATDEGVLEVMQKLAELKPNVQLWYRDEAQFEQALKSGEIPMGQYYHDVTGLAAKEGFPVRSTFPKEGGISDSGSWAISSALEKVDEAHEFMNFTTTPAIQALMARQIGTAPIIRRELLDLTDDEFNAVSSSIDPIVPRYELYVDKADWVNQKWTELIVS
ncbi:ABC transporter substrate-binding protein [Aureimonas altamirensis]|uniref:ABC transporter substrate-binding protein n=1 Tax=Aureimonas altamirensis TaxID=370622 RepID=UPI003B96DA92